MHGLIKYVHSISTSHYIIVRYSLYTSSTARLSCTLQLQHGRLSALAVRSNEAAEVGHLGAAQIMRPLALGVVDREGAGVAGRC